MWSAGGQAFTSARPGPTLPGALAAWSSSGGPAAVGRGSPWWQGLGVEDEDWGPIHGDQPWGVEAPTVGQRPTVVEALLDLHPHMR
jgi:hypothetical protein